MLKPLKSKFWVFWLLTPDPNTSDRDVWEALKGKGDPDPPSRRRHPDSKISNLQNNYNEKMDKKLNWNHFAAENQNIARENVEKKKKAQIIPPPKKRTKKVCLCSSPLHPTTPPSLLCDYF